MKKTIALALCSAFGLTVVHADGAAENYPDKPIKLLMPLSAGSGGDTIGRMLADAMGKDLKQPVFVENKPGAAGIIGTSLVARAPKDGYTIIISGMTTHIIAPGLYKNLPYDPEKSFSPIGRIGTASLVVVATNDFPANDLKGLAQWSQSQPRPVQFASWGTGSTGHLCGEVLAQKAGAKLEHIPFKGASDVVTGLLGSHIQLGILDMATGSPHVLAKRLKPEPVSRRRAKSLAMEPAENRHSGQQRRDDTEKSFLEHQRRRSGPDPQHQRRRLHELGAAKHLSNPHLTQRRKNDD